MLNRLFDILKSSAGRLRPRGSRVGHQRGPSDLAALLGYPKDTKLLIVHGVDLGMADAVNRATLATLEEQAITSASVMVPCPRFAQVAAYAKAHPHADLGIHLTLTSEWESCRWGSILPRDKAPSLLDRAGYFWQTSNQFARHALPSEVELEIRAQVERAIRSGLVPTHLDCHMGTLFLSRAMYAAYVKVAEDYGFPYIVTRGRRPPLWMKAGTDGHGIVLEELITADKNVSAANWNEFYAGVLQNLRPGLSELLVHLWYADEDLKALTLGHSGWGPAR